MQFDDALLGTELDARASWEIQSGSILKLKNANCVVAKFARNAFKKRKSVHGNFTKNPNRLKMT